MYISQSTSNDPYGQTYGESKWTDFYNLPNGWHTWVSFSQDSNQPKKKLKYVERKDRKKARTGKHLRMTETK